MARTFEKDHDELSGLAFLRLAPKTDLEQIEKDLRATPGIQFCHRLPRRWLMARRRRTTAADPLLNIEVRPEAACHLARALRQDPSVEFVEDPPRRRGS